MRSSFWFAWVLAGLILVAVTGCGDKVPESELDKFIARSARWEGKALDDTLRSIARGGSAHAVYANYLIGNRFYQAAGDSALTAGWGDPYVNAQLDSAEIYFSRAVAQDSTFIEPLVNLGSLWDDRSEQLSARKDRDERIAQAEQFYRMALEVDPADEKARCNLGSLHLRQRRTHEALMEFQKALEYDPRSALAHYNIAIMFAEAKIYREAINEWELASKYDPDGDIGERSRENIKIVQDLINVKPPALDK
jgi:tetratricopeptide (TPR) repeat protein